MQIFFEMEYQLGTIFDKHRKKAMFEILEPMQKCLKVLPLLTIEDVNQNSALFQQFASNVRAPLTWGCELSAFLYTLLELRGILKENMNLIRTDSVLCGVVHKADGTDIMKQILELITGLSNKMDWDEDRNAALELFQKIKTTCLQPGAVQEFIQKLDAVDLLVKKLELIDTRKKTFGMTCYEQGRKQVGWYAK